MALFQPEDYKHIAMTGPNNHQVMTQPNSHIPGTSMKFKIAALLRGFARCCPACGGGRVFAGYINVEEECSSCSIPLSQYRSDDVPAYFTVFIWIQAAIWLPLTLVLTLYLLPRIKGMVLALLWLLRIKG